MDQQIQTLKPNYRKIYFDIINEKFPEKKEILKTILTKSTFSALDIININKMIFGNENKQAENQKYRSYDKTDILQILDYKKKNQLNNIEVANHFKISRNSVSKWKKLYSTI